MDLPYNFVHLPLAFDAERLTEEVAIFSEEDWRAHPSGSPGNSALQFISTEGEHPPGAQLPSSYSGRGKS